jgi:hypothetical protein
VRRVGQLLADDPGDEDGPVPVDLPGGQVGADQAAALQPDAATLGTADVGGQLDLVNTALAQAGLAAASVPPAASAVRAAAATILDLTHILGIFMVFAPLLSCW